MRYYLRTFSFLLMLAGAMSALVILNSWVTYNYGKQEEPFDWFFVIWSTLGIWVTWAVILPALLPVLRSLKPSLRRFNRKWVLLIFIILVTAFFHRYLSLAFYAEAVAQKNGFRLDLFGSHSLGWVIRGFFSSVLQMVFILVSYYAWLEIKMRQQQQLELSRLNEALSDAELNALKMQLHPHFFFNTLNTISSLMQTNVEQAQEVVSRLGDLMRNMLKSNRQQTVSLSEELGYIQDYLKIEKIRFSDRLTVTYDIADACLQAKVPNLLLQPLVENAIKHGFSVSDQSMTLEIRATRNENKLLLMVRDDGYGASNLHYSRSKGGIGLNSVESRLKHLYPGESSLEITTSRGAGFGVKITIPFSEKEQDGG